MYFDWKCHGHDGSSTRQSIYVVEVDNVSLQFHSPTVFPLTMIVYIVETLALSSIEYLYTLKNFHH